MAAKSGFAERLAYVRWLRNRGRVSSESDREFAAQLGVTYGWLTKWKIRHDAPKGRAETKAIAHALAPMGVTDGWLFDDEGEPPEPKLWPVWTAGAHTTRFGQLVEDPRGRPRKAEKPTGRAAVRKAREA